MSPRPPALLPQLKCEKGGMRSSSGEDAAGMEGRSERTILEMKVQIL